MADEAQQEEEEEAAFRSGLVQLETLAEGKLEEMLEEAQKKGQQLRLELLGEEYVAFMADAPEESPAEGDGEEDIVEGTGEVADSERK